MEENGFYLEGVWTLDDIGFTAKALFDLWKFDGSYPWADPEDFKLDSHGNLFAPGAPAGFSAPLSELDRMTREYLESKGRSVEKEYLPHLRYMYHNHLSIGYFEEIPSPIYEPPERVFYRFISDGTKLLFSDSVYERRKQDEVIDRQLGVLRKYDGPGGNVVIPDNVTIIAENAFRNRLDVTGLVIPAGVRRIEKQAFMDCRKLKRVIFMGKETHLGFFSFYTLSKSLIFDCPNSSPAHRYAQRYGLHYRVTEWD